MSYRISLVSLISILVVALSTWTTISYRQQNPTITLTTALPDAYMEDVTATIMDKQGHVSMRIVTPKMTHYVENDTSEFISPELTIYRKSPQPWFITANFAKATQGIDNVYFWNDVAIHHSADLQNPATIIKTATLNVKPEEKLADTSDLITLIQPNIIVKGTGMHADINTGDIKLLAEAQGEYVPNS